MGWAWAGVYCATKFAVEGISSVMRAPLGIPVTVVEPEPFRTDFLDASSLGQTERTAGAMMVEILP
jgi:NADP-dependent 3-hydroxy acid dehydrogenase YdfG